MRDSNVRRARQWAFVVLALLGVVAFIVSGLRSRAVPPSSLAADASSPPPSSAAAGGPRARPRYPVPSWEAVLLPGVSVEDGGTGAAGTFEGRLVATPSEQGIAGGEVGFVGPGGGQHVVRTGEGGQFSFTPPSEGAYEVTFAQAAGFVPLVAAPGESPLVLLARAGKSLKGVAIHLAQVSDIEGLVVNEAGEPVGAAKISAFGADNVALTAPWTTATTSDDKGKFKVSAPEGSVVDVAREGFRTARARVDFKVAVSRRLRITLVAGASERPSCEITGTVTDEHGVSLPGVSVAAVVEPKNPADNEALMNPGAQTRTDSGGRFTLGPLAEASYTVTAVESGLAPAIAANVRAAPGAPGRVSLVVRAGGKLEGTVKDAATGAPLAAFAIVVRRSTGPMTFETAAVRTVFDADGHYELRGLGAGLYRVAASARDYARAVDQDVTVGPAPARADFQMTRGARLVGVVRDRPTKKPLAGASISMEGRGGAESEANAFVSTAVTDVTGQFELTGIGAGQQSLLVMAKGHHGRVVIVPASSAPRALVGPLDIDLSPTAKDEDPSVELTGIGAVLAAKDTALVIGVVVPTGGAAAAGLAPDDAILAIDGVPVTDLGFQRAIDAIRGPEGTFVTLRVRKRGASTAVDVVVERKKFAA